MPARGFGRCQIFFLLFNRARVRVQRPAKNQTTVPLRTAIIGRSALSLGPDALRKRSGKSGRVREAPDLIGIIRRNRRRYSGKSGASASNVKIAGFSQSFFC